MSISLDQARQIADASLAKGHEMGLKPLSVFILDPRGATVAALSEDGVSQLRARIAHGKANAAIGLGMGTRALMNRAEQQAYFIQAVNGVFDGDMVPVPGGVLIQDAGGALLGAVGISGDTSDNDEAAAIAGIEAAGLSAKVDWGAGPNSARLATTRSPLSSWQASAAKTPAMPVPVARQASAPSSATSLVWSIDTVGLP